MATKTSTPSNLSIKISQKKTSGSGTIEWTAPSIPSDATITSCMLTGTITPDGSITGATIGGKSIGTTSGSFSVSLGTTITSSADVTVTRTAPSINTNTTIDFTNMTYTVTYEEAVQVKTYTVTFKSGYDGSTITTKTVEEGKSATAPIAPVIEGYRFTGWDKDFSNVTSDLTVTAQYEKDDNGSDSRVNLFPSFIYGGWKCTATDEFEMTPIDDFNAEFSSISAYYSYSANISQFKGKTIKVLVEDIRLVSMRICRNGSTTIGSIISSLTGFESYCTIPDDDNSYSIQIVPVSQGTLDSSITNAQLYILGEETSIRAYTVEFGPYDYIPGNTDNALKVEGVLEGKDATPPENVPNRDGYRFIGWSGSYTNVTSDLALIAQYEKEIPDEPEEPEVSLNTQIRLGGQPVESLYFGEDAILKIYFGDEIIYSFEETPTP